MALTATISFIDPKVPTVECDESRLHLVGHFVRVTHKDERGYTAFPVRTIWRIEVREDDPTDDDYGDTSA